MLCFGVISYVPKVGFKEQENKGWGARPEAPPGATSMPVRLSPVWLLLPACLPCRASGQEMSPGQKASVLLSQALSPLGSLLCDPRF